MTTINKIIKKKRQDLKLSQTDFAKTLGFSRSYIAQLEAEQTKPSLEFLEKFQNVFKDVKFVFDEANIVAENVHSTVHPNDNLYSGTEINLKELFDLRNSLLSITTILAYEGYIFKDEEIKTLTNIVDPLNSSNLNIESTQLKYKVELSITTCKILLFKYIGMLTTKNESVENFSTLKEITKVFYKTSSNELGTSSANTEYMDRIFGKKPNWLDEILKDEKKIDKNT